MESKIISIVARVLNEDISRVTSNSSAENMMQWDSLKQMQIIMAVEDEFKIKVADDSLLHAVSIKSLTDIVLASTLENS